MSLSVDNISNRFNTTQFGYECVALHLLPCALTDFRPQIGYFLTDHWFEPCSTIMRAVEEAAEALRGLGHEVLAFEPPKSGWEVRFRHGALSSDTHGFNEEACKSE